MGKRTTILLTAMSAAALTLTGCNESDMAKVNQITQQFNQMAEQFEAISENVNVIAEKAEAIDTEQINESVASITQSAEELSEMTEETVESVNDISEDVSEADVAEITEEDIAEAFEGTPIGNIMDLSGRSNQAIIDARARYEEGMAMIMEGYEGLKNIADNSSAASTAKGTIRDSFDYAVEMAEGANIVADSINILRDEYKAMGEDVVEFADAMGIENDNIDLLKEILEKIPDDKIVAVSPEIIDKLSDAEAEMILALNNPENVDKVEIEPVVEEVFDEVEPIADQIDAYKDKSTEYYKQANKAAQKFLSDVKAAGSGDVTTDAVIDYVDDFLKAYEDLDVGSLIDDKQIDDVKDMLVQSEDQVLDSISSVKEQIKNQLKKEKE